MPCPAKSSVRFCIFASVPKSTTTLKEFYTTKILILFFKPIFVVFVMLRYETSLFKNPCSEKKNKYLVIYIDRLIKMQKQFDSTKRSIHIILNSINQTKQQLRTAISFPLPIGGEKCHLWIKGIDPLRDTDHKDGWDCVALFLKYLPSALGMTEIWWAIFGIKLDNWKVVS